jgi:hypothetical protein
VASRTVWYGDESYDVRPGKCQYFMGMTRPIGDPGEVRAGLRDRVLRRGGVLHFYDEDERRQWELVDAVRLLGFEMVVVSWSGASPAARARSRCLTAVARQLHGRADGLVLESVNPKSDARDVRTLSRLHPAAHRLPVRFVDKQSDPLVWASDILAGAALQAFARGRTQFFDALGASHIADES